jgi:hypothetical protein
MWERWISEIVADLWSVSRVGVSSTLGLIGVVSLPRAFVFRINAEDPHPSPWIRVRLSCALGAALFPHPQWGRIDALWQSLYPVTDASPAQQHLFGMLDATMKEFVRLLLAHRPAALRGRSLFETLGSRERQPGQLSALFAGWRGAPHEMRDNPPSLVFAAIGQARADGTITPEEESDTLAYLLTYWALRSTLDIAEVCATHSKPRLRRRRPSPTSTAALAAV